MSCAECHHAEHLPGACERCNCGESYTVRITGYLVRTLGGSGFAHANKRAGLTCLERRSSSDGG